MGVDVYWGSGSPYSWRVLLALEHKRIAYSSHQLKFDKQEHKAPQILSMNFRGKVPILKDGDYVVFESLAILYYLDRKYPNPPLFGASPEEGGVIMRVICEYQSYAEEHVNRIAGAFFFAERPHNLTDLARSMHAVAAEARSIEMRLAHSDWVVGERYSAADMVIYPGLMTLLRALSKPAAKELSARFLPLEVNYPALARWAARVASLPGYERTYPPHWKENP